MVKKERAQRIVNIAPIRPDHLNSSGLRNTLYNVPSKENDKNGLFFVSLLSVLGHLAFVATRH